MTKNLILLCIVFSIGCLSKHSNDKIKEPNKEFTEFLTKFDSLQLPFNVIGYYDFRKFSDSTWLIKTDKTILVQNPLLKPIEISGFKFIKSKYPIDKQYIYYTVCKKIVNGYYLAVMKQINFQNNEYWLKLNLFDLSGGLLDTLTFAGQKVGYYNKYGRVKPNLSITTLSYHDIKVDTTNLDNYYATEIRNEYTISKDGRFILQKSKKERGYFTTYGENNIVSRVDTIEGKYKH